MQLGYYAFVRQARERIPMEETTTTRSPAPGEVLRGLAAEVDALGTETMDRMVIQSVSPYEYVARTYAAPQAEYEGVRVTFDQPE